MNGYTMDVFNNDHELQTELYNRPCIMKFKNKVANTAKAVYNMKTDRVKMADLEKQKLLLKNLEGIMRKSPLYLPNKVYDLGMVRVSVDANLFEDEATQQNYDHINA